MEAFIVILDLVLLGVAMLIAYRTFNALNKQCDELLEHYLEASAKAKAYLVIIGAYDAIVAEIKKMCSSKKALNKSKIKKLIAEGEKVFKPAKKKK